MLDLCKCFAWHKINAALPLNTETDKRLLGVLQSSYSNSRYSSTFEVDANDAEELLIRVIRLSFMADAMNDKRINQYTEAVLRLKKIQQLDQRS